MMKHTINSRRACVSQPCSTTPLRPLSPLSFSHHARLFVPLTSSPSISSHSRRFQNLPSPSRISALSILTGQQIRPFTTSVDGGDSEIESSTTVAVQYVARSLDLVRVKELAGLLRGVVKRANDCVHVALPKADIFFFKDGTLACWGATVEEQRLALESVARPSVSKPLIPGTSLPGTGIEQVPSNLSQSVRVRFASPSWFDNDDDGTSNSGTSSGGDDDNRANILPVGFSFPSAAQTAASATRPCALASLSGRTLTLATPRAADGRAALRTEDARRAVSSALGRSLQLTCHEQRASVIAIETDVLPEALASKGEVALESKDIAKLLGQTFLLKRCAQLLASSAATAAAELAAALSEQKYSQDVLMDLGNNSSSDSDDSGSGSWSTRSLAARTEAGSSGSNLSLPSPSPLLQLQSEVEAVCGMRGRVAALQGSLDELQELLEEVRDLEANAHGSRLEWIVIVLVAVETLVGIAEFVELLSGAFKLQ